MLGYDVRLRLLEHLAIDGINATFHYVPLHSSIGAAMVTDRVADCPVTDDVSGRLIRLPFFNDMTASEQDQVCESTLRFLERAHA